MSQLIEKLNISTTKEKIINITEQIFNVLKKFKRVKIIINPSEKTKNIGSVNTILNLLLKNNFNRNNFYK